MAKLAFPNHKLDRRQFLTAVLTTAACMGVAVPFVVATEIIGVEPEGLGLISLPGLITAHRPGICTAVNR